MAKFIITFIALVSFSHAAMGEEFIREGWPGKGTPGFAAKNDVLILHETPDKTSPTRNLRFKAGWRIVWDQSKVITRKSVIWTVTKEIDEGSCGTIAPGVKVEFLQFENQGWGTFRVDDKLCSLKATRNKDFDKAEGYPKVEWWIRVLDNTKSSVGWLLIDAKQIDHLPRKP